MPNYRRAIVQGGTYFFTVVTYGRRPVFEYETAVRLLGNVMRRCQLRWPMEINAIVLLPDHMHTIWSLPSGDNEYSKRIAWIKREFTSKWLKAGGKESEVSVGKSNQRRRGVWQPRFWEHTIEEDDEFDAYFDYIHWNPVKHGYVECPKDWPHSSFHRWAAKGVYPVDWGCGQNNQPKSTKEIRAVGE